MRKDSAASSRFKMSLSSAIVRRSLPRIGESLAETGGIKSWILSGSFYIGDNSTGDEIYLNNVNLYELMRYVVFDYERFALSCWESFSVFKGELSSLKLLGWPFIKLYYSAFFGAHAAMRVTGEAVFRVESDHAKRLSDLVAMFVSPSFLVSAGTYHAKTIQKPDRTLSVTLTKLPDTGGAHDGFWRIFSSYLDSIEQDTIKNKQPDAALVISKAAEIRRITKAYGGSSGNWLSVIRNRINYGHDFGVWFPVKGSHPSLEDLKGMSLKGHDLIRLDMNPGKEPLKAFAFANQTIACLSFEISEQIAAQSDAATRFGSKWKRLRADLKDGVAFES